MFGKKETFYNNEKQEKGGPTKDGKSLGGKKDKNSYQITSQ